MSGSMIQETAQVFDDSLCELGEGVLWLPGRQAFAWFDIEGKCLHLRGNDVSKRFDFSCYATCAARTSEQDDGLMVVTQQGLVQLDLETGLQEVVVPIAELGGAYRPNDGRADPWGGFWFSRMALDGQSPTGAIYRYWRGELRCLQSAMEVPNSICFNPKDRSARWSDTRKKRIYSQPLDSETGWPSGAASVAIDFNDVGLKPDGAIFDQDGGLWVAHWGAGYAARYDQQGQETCRVGVHASNVSCPAFGGPDFATLMLTTARHKADLTDPIQAAHAGQSFQLESSNWRGLPEPLLAP